MRRSQYRLAFFLLVSLNFVAESSLVAAQTTSIIEGTVSDQQHLAIVGAEITLSSPTIPRDLVTQTEGTGAYRIRGLPAGTYNLHVAKDGFTEKTYRELTITVNRLLILDVVMTISPVREDITVSGDPPLLETTISSSGATILPRQIDQMPINGRNYLDLMQLVAGVTVNRQVDVGTDAAVPMLGERGGNVMFLIDGMPNKNAVDGGAAAPFDQDSILEFQTFTAGYVRRIRTRFRWSCKCGKQKRNQSMAWAFVWVSSQQRI